MGPTEEGAGGWSGRAWWAAAAPLLVPGWMMDGGWRGRMMDGRVYPGTLASIDTLSSGEGSQVNDA